MTLANCTVWVPRPDPNEKHCGRYKRHSWEHRDESFVIEPTDPMVHKMAHTFQCRQCGWVLRVQSLVVVPEAGEFDGGLIYEIPQHLLVAARGRIHSYARVLSEL